MTLLHAGSTIWNRISWTFPSLWIYCFDAAAMSEIMARFDRCQLSNGLYHYAWSGSWPLQGRWTPQGLHSTDRDFANFVRLTPG